MSTDYAMRIVFPLPQHLLGVGALPLETHCQKPVSDKIQGGVEVDFRRLVFAELSASPDRKGSCRLAGKG